MMPLKVSQKIPTKKVLNLKLVPTPRHRRIELIAPDIVK